MGLPISLIEAVILSLAVAVMKKIICLATKKVRALAGMGNKVSKMPHFIVVGSISLTALGIKAMLNHSK